MLVGTVAVLLWREWTVAFIALVVIPTLALVSDYFSRRIKDLSKTQRAREGELASTTQEMLTSIRLVQSYGRGRLDLRRFSEQTDQSMRAAVGVATVAGAVQLRHRAARGPRHLGDRVDRCAAGRPVRRSPSARWCSSSSSRRTCSSPSRKIVSEWYKVGKVLASVDRIDDLLGLAPAVEDAPDAVPAPALAGRSRPSRP